MRVLRYFPLEQLALEPNGRRPWSSFVAVFVFRIQIQIHSFSVFRSHPLMRKGAGTGGTLERNKQCQPTLMN